MANKRVIIEFRYQPELDAAARSLDAAAGIAAAEAAMRPAVAFSLDPTFAPVRLPGLVPRTRDADPADTGALLALDTAPEAASYLMRGEVEEQDAAALAAQVGNNVTGVFADAVMEPQLVCPGSAPVGTHLDVERLLCVRRMRRCRMNGRGVLVAIVDGGVNLAYLNAQGKNPTFDAARSFSTVPGVVPGSAPVGHGTMCAFDACIAAQRCTLLDIAVLRPFDGTPSGFGALLSDIVRAYAHLLNVMLAPRRPGDLRSMVVNNSWGLFSMAWDFPPGDPSNYSDNPNHPFNRAVATLERAGADILFAAGNCGADCPDGRCDTTVNTIRGANGHPAVLCVAGVDTTKARVGYSSIGPGRLAQNKPDISGYTHFQGSGVYAADGGTSAACPVVAGVVAAVRSKRPYNPASPATAPAAIRGLMTRTAEDLGAAGYDFAHGFGVANGCTLARRLCDDDDDDDDDDIAGPIPDLGPISDLCRRFPWICKPHVPPIFDLCRRYPWLCQQMVPIPPRLPPDPPFGADGTMQPADLQDEAEFAYMMGLLHGQQLASSRAAATAEAPAKPGGCGRCKD